MPSSSPRRDALLRFAERAAGEALSIEPASADASFRSYWRVRGADGASRIVMDAPPDKESVEPWLDVGARLRRAGLHAPEVHAVDRAEGFILMEDLGSRPYLPELDASSADALYADALDALARMQTQVDTRGLPPFDDAFVRMELGLMPEWFLGRHLGHVPDEAGRAAIERAEAAIAAAVRDQPQGFMHRDYHSRNLMVVAAPAGANPGIIDFQGAVAGPLTYDLASLLRDCYVAWDEERVEGWAEGYRERLARARLLGPAADPAAFRRAFDLTGLQRHLKVLGLFCRLWYRDGKPQYLADLPLVFRYATGVARRYRELAPLADLLERARGGRDLAQPRGAAPA